MSKLVKPNRAIRPGVRVKVNNNIPQFKNKHGIVLALHGNVSEVLYAGSKTTMIAINQIDVV